MTKESDEFEHVTQLILNNLREHLGYERVEESKKYPGQRSKVKRQVDVTAYRTDGKKILVECKLHKRPIDVEYMEAFYYKIFRDVEADGGLMVSSVGFTEGATGVANAEMISMAVLNPDATEHEYLLEISGHLWRGVSFEDIVPITDEFKFTSVVNFVNILPISDEWSLQSIPVEGKED